jgi:hypothetical protein
MAQRQDAHQVLVFGLTKRFFNSRISEWASTKNLRTHNTPREACRDNAGLFDASDRERCDVIKTSTPHVPDTILLFSF